MGVMNTNWMRTFKTELRWALRVSPKDRSSRRKPYFLRDGYTGELLLWDTKREADWEARWETGNVTTVKVRVTVEEIS